jgi:endoglucanase
MFLSLLRYRSKISVFSLAMLLLPASILLAVPSAFPQYTGYWHTGGGQILDSSGKSVRIGGVNWYGFETTDEVAHGLSSQDYKTILSTIHSLGYNTVRLPYSNQMVEQPIIPSNIAYTNAGGAINTDLKGLNSLQIMDKIVAEAGVLGLKVILDNHRSEAGNSAEASGLWYTGAYPESSWIADWKTLVARYAAYTDAGGNPTVVGVDLRNEPHNATSGGSCWTGDTGVGGCPATNTAQNWPAAAGRAAKAVLAVNSKLLIFVEGVDCYDGDCDFWGGNLEGVRNYPAQVDVAQRLVYSAHDYGPTEYRQSWFNASTTAQSLQAIWTKFWAYVSIDGIAPVWVGEFGTTNDAASAESTVAGSEGQWFSSLVGFLGNQPAINWTYWALNGEDNYGLLDSNYDATPPSSLKQQLLSSIQAKSEVKTPPCAAVSSAPAGVTATATSASTINVEWTAVAPPPNCSVTYSVFRGTASTFPLASSTQVAGNLTSPSYPDSGLAASTTYYYALVALDADGASASSPKVSATTGAATACNALPSAPSGLTGTTASSTAITLAWNPVTPPASCKVTYSIFRGTASGFPRISANQIAGNLTTDTYSDTSLTPGTTYYYAMVAVDSKGASPSSPQAAATTAKSSTGKGGCQVTYTIQSQWSNGFQAAIAIKNTGTADIESWTLVFAFPGNQQVATLWNANYTQSGEAMTLTSEAYNGSIPAGTTYNSIGLTGTYTGSNPAPSSFSLNGTVCQ